MCFKDDICDRVSSKCAVRKLQIPEENRELAAGFWMARSSLGEGYV